MVYYKFNICLSLPMPMLIIQEGVPPRTDSLLHAEQPNPPPPMWHGSDSKAQCVSNHINDMDNGFHDWEHMKIKGRIRFKQVLVLIDSGCTHNFISSKVVQVLGLKSIKRSEPYVVHLPDGSNQLWTNVSLYQIVYKSHTILTIIQWFVFLAITNFHVTSNPTLIKAIFCTYNKQLKRLNI